MPWEWRLITNSRRSTNKTHDVLSCIFISYHIEYLYIFQSSRNYHQEGSIIWYYINLNYVFLYIINIVYN
jgi:hypothetical protein